MELDQLKRSIEEQALKNRDEVVKNSNKNEQNIPYFSNEDENVVSLEPKRYDYFNENIKHKDLIAIIE